MLWAKSSTKKSKVIMRELSKPLPRIPMFVESEVVYTVADQKWNFFLQITHLWRVLPMFPFLLPTVRPNITNNLLIHVLIILVSYERVIENGSISSMGIGKFDHVIEMINNYLSRAIEKISFLLQIRSKTSPKPTNRLSFRKKGRPVSNVPIYEKKMSSEV